jgi:hypothetical protein
MRVWVKTANNIKYFKYLKVESNENITEWDFIYLRKHWIRSVIKCFNKSIYSGLLTPNCRVYDLCEVIDRDSLVHLLQQIHDECEANADGRYIIQC